MAERLIISAGYRISIVTLVTPGIQTIQLVHYHSTDQHHSWPGAGQGRIQDFGQGETIILGTTMLLKFRNKKLQNSYKIFARWDKPPKIRNKTSKNR